MQPVIGAVPKIVMIPAGLGTLDKTFHCTGIDWSNADKGYIKTLGGKKDRIIPLTSILYIEED